MRIFSALFLGGGLLYGAERLMSTQGHSLLDPACRAIYRSAVDGFQSSATSHALGKYRQGLMEKGVTFERGTMVEHRGEEAALQDVVQNIYKERDMAGDAGVFADTFAQHFHGKDIAGIQEAAKSNPFTGEKEKHLFDELKSSVLKKAQRDVEHGEIPSGEQAHILEDIVSRKIHKVDGKGDYATINGNKIPLRSNPANQAELATEVREKYAPVFSQPGPLTLKDAQTQLAWRGVPRLKTSEEFREKCSTVYDYTLGDLRKTSAVAWLKGEDGPVETVRSQYKSFWSWLGSFFE